MDEKKFSQCIAINNKIESLKKELLTVDLLMNSPVVISHERQPFSLSEKIIVSNPNRILSMIREELKAKLFEAENLFKTL
ncbi:MAG: hypothetical protein V4547_10555 [Bacteroidota bacterium]